ncbi:MAG TPA: efflux RND transporter permease subunit, partial [Pseudobdellovibrionaceae bacterium]
FGLTIVFTMLISLFDAFTVAPMLSAYMASPAEHNKGNGFIARILKAFDTFQTRLEDLYERFLVKALKYPKSVLAIATFVFVASMMTLPFIPKTFLPTADNGEFSITVELPVGTSLQGTANFTKGIEDILKKDPTIDMVLTTVGSANGEANKASLFVRLVDRKNRQLTTTQTKTVVREKVLPFKEKAIVEVGDIDAVNSGQKPFNLNITGDDLESLSKYANTLKERLRKIPGLIDVDTNFRSGKPEFHVVFEREKTEHLGVSTAMAGAELRYRTEGAEAAVFRENGIEYKVRVRLEEKYRDLREQFNSTFVPNSNNNMISLNRIAKAEDAFGYSQINRQNKNRFINLAGNLGPNGSLGGITTEVQRILKEDLPPPPGVDCRFQGQAEDFQDLISSMLLAIFLGVLFIYLVLSSLYESFVTPFTILLALPLAMCGAMVALLVFGKSIDIFSLIGIVLLLGVVAKNSILLVDYTKQMEQQGFKRNEALLKASRTRLRPILMTSLALIAGMIPIAIGLNEASAMRTSMGIAIIGGLISSTVLTLIVVPAAYGFIDDFRVAAGRFFSRFGGRHHSHEVRE